MKQIRFENILMAYQREVKAIKGIYFAFESISYMTGDRNYYDDNNKRRKNRFRS